MSRTVGVDFDAVIHRYSRGWYDGTIYDPPVPGAVQALRVLMDQFAVYIFTARPAEQIPPWLEPLGLDATCDERCVCRTDPDGAGTDCRCRGTGLISFWNQRGRLLVTNRKLPAVAYIDDSAIRFRSWPQALGQLAGVLDNDGGPPEPPAMPLIEAAIRLNDYATCCDMHNKHCEPPADLCCPWCAEARHPDHPPDTVCVLLQP